jgi:hypothetical protein
LTEKLAVGVAVTNREVVDPDEPYSIPDKRGGAGAVQADEVLRESVAFPETRVPRLQQHTLGAPRKAEAVDEMRVHRFSGGRRVEDHARPDKRLKRELVGAVPIRKEVTRRINVRTSMRPELDPRDVRRIAIHERLHELNRDTWVAFVDRHPRTDCDGDVEQFASRHNPTARSLIVSSHKDRLRQAAGKQTHNWSTCDAKVGTRFLPTDQRPLASA